MREPLPEMEKTVRNMASRQSHRGPDFQGIYVAPDRRTGLSHARLSIIDLSPKANQPMTNEDSSLWLVLNGEIYNHGELREQLLKKGHVFRSKSDAEVVLHLYEEEGTDLLGRLHGMFSFVIWDKKKGRLFGARDRLGKKPFVYAQTDSGFAVASEIPALHEVSGIDWSVDPVALGLFLLRNVRHIPDPWTFYKGVRRLNPGHAMIVENGEIKKIWRYWHPRFEPRECSIEELRSIFDRAVDLRRVADVEVAALLSGGVDSSGIVQSMIQQGSAKPRTYALGRDKNDEELRRARRMADYLGTSHREFYFDPDLQHDHFLHLLGLYGEPIMLLPLMFTYELCRRIHEDGVRVVMAGHGADEIFYGYSGHRTMALVSEIERYIPSPLSGILKRVADTAPVGSRAAELFGVLASPAGRRKAMLYRQEARKTWTTLFSSPEILSEIDSSIEEWLSLWFGDRVPGSYIDEASFIGLMHENSHSVTIAGDLPAMAASVEVRCPFLDQDLVDLAISIPYQDKVRAFGGDRENKLILKKAMEGRIPGDVLNAPKRGFGYYIQESEVLRGPWKEKVDVSFNEFNDLGGLLNSRAVRSLKKQFDSDPGAPSNLIAKLYSLEVSARSGGMN